VVSANFWLLVYLSKIIIVREHLSIDSGGIYSCYRLGERIFFSNHVEYFERVALLLMMITFNLVTAVEDKDRGKVVSPCRTKGGLEIVGCATSVEYTVLHHRNISWCSRSLKN